MPNLKPLLPNFPISKLFVLGLLVSPVLSFSSAMGATCEGLFRPATLAEARQQQARDAVRSEILATSGERETAITAMMEQIQKDLSDSLRARESARLQVPRPRVMTGDERRFAIESGNYNHVDHPAPARRPLTELEKRLQEMQEMRLSGLQIELSGITQRAAIAREIPASSVRLAAENPELLALVYGQITGLNLRLGAEGQALKNIIEGNRLPKTQEIQDLSEMVSILRASNTTPAATARLDQMMAEVLLAEIALTRSGERR